MVKYRLYRERCEVGFRCDVYNEQSQLVARMYGKDTLVVTNAAVIEALADMAARKIEGIVVEGK